ncbi:acyltransferase family protein, partial [Streptomyces sp. URMC 129]|uniref:acyltransferase family protein n=1 Tax=Streptomyces sp. URMC 129 TaxID=3423407 RepID=UPI003F1E41EC
MTHSRQLTDTPAVALPSQSATGTGAGAATGSGGPGERDAFFDNAKYLAIVLVALGHAWEPLREGSRTVMAVYMAVYAFHMPAFIVIAGYFSRGFDGRADRVRRLITGVLVPYLIFQTAYTLFLRWLEDDRDTYLPLLEPRWLLWFLMALFIWRLTVPLWKALRWPVPVALAVAALGSVSPSLGGDLQLQRVLQFLPFFVLGLTLTEGHVAAVRRRAVRLAAVPVFAAALLVAYWAAPRMDHVWLYHKGSAQELGEPWWTGVVMTGVLFGCALLLTACFFALVPGRRTWFTVLGAGTLYGYLLHGFLVRGARDWGWYDPDVMHEQPAAFLLASAVAAA